MNKFFKSNTFYNITAFFLIALMCVLTVFSIKNDSLTFDEKAHIAAGYSYLTKLDMRLNPEHPPLIKDLAAFPLLFLNLEFPENDPSWLQKDNPVWWLQFDFGHQFLYRANNNPEQIIFWSRIPMILILALFAWFVFFWTKKLFNRQAALLALFLFSFSPTLLAHGRLVTTDVGAAFSVTLVIFFWLKFLKKPNLLNTALATAFLGLAMLIKFSFVLLGPLLVITALIYAIVKSDREKIKNVLKYFALSALIGISAIILIVCPVYYAHIWNFPKDQQIRDIRFNLETSVIPKPLVKLDLALASHEAGRPLAHFLMGVLMSVNRSSTGNTTYFMGKISGQGFRSYFPIIYLIKEPLTLHLLSLGAILYLLIFLVAAKSSLKKWEEFVKRHISELSIIIFILIYWAISLSSKLNIGIRHLLPIIPLVIILTAGAISSWLKSTYYKKAAFGLLALMIIWQFASVMLVYPHYLSYFNESIGGPKNGYKYATDSNLDWGQDLKRLKNWLDENNISEKIYIDYFGGGDFDYYLGQDKYARWNSKDNPDKMPKPSWFAISVNQMVGGQGKAVKGYDQDTTFYNWLKQYEPTTIVGHSIFVYQIR